MITKAYHFLVNSFLVVTFKNYKKLLTLASNHEGKLVANQSDPVVAAILSVFTPVFESYKATDLNLMSALGFYKGETQTVERLFAQLQDDKIKQWEGKIFNFFPQGSVEATQLFPQHRSPFNKGTYENRIQAVASLAKGCGAFSDLAPVAAMITAFHVQIASARALQLSDGEGKVELLRNLRESARIAVCQQLYGNLGLLMNHFRTDPLQVDRFFDFSLLRRKASSSSKEITAAGKVMHAQTGDSVANATVKFTLPDNETITVQTDENGHFEAELGAHNHTILVKMQVSKEGFVPFSLSEQVEPGEDVEFTVQLEFTSAPPVT
jgi:hypothetical protein